MIRGSVTFAARSGASRQQTLPQNLANWKRLALGSERLLESVYDESYIEQKRDALQSAGRHSARAN